MEVSTARHRGVEATAAERLRLVPRQTLCSVDSYVTNEPSFVIHPVVYSVVFGIPESNVMRPPYGGDRSGISLSRRPPKRYTRPSSTTADCCNRFHQYGDMSERTSERANLHRQGQWRWRGSDRSPFGPAHWIEGCLIIVAATTTE